MKPTKEIKISARKIRLSVNADYREALAFTMLIYKLNPNTIFTITREDLCKQLHMKSTTVNRLLDAAQDFSLIQYDKETFRLQRFKLSSNRHNFNLNPDRLTSFTACKHWIIKCILMEDFYFTKYVYNLYKFRFNPYMKGKRAEVYELHKKAKKVLKYGKYINYNYFGHSYEWMAKKVEVSKSTIRSIIREMIKDGLVVAKPNYKKVKGLKKESFTKAGLEIINNEFGYNGFIRIIKGAVSQQFANYYDVLDTSILPWKKIFFEI